MKYLLILFLPLIASCGIHLSSDPVEVSHTVSIDFASIDKFCTETCRGFLGDEVAFNSCKSDCIVNATQAILEGLK